MEGLTLRQQEIARTAISARTNREIAVKLGIAEGTVKLHLHAIYERLGVQGRKDLILALQDRIPGLEERRSA